MRALGILLSCWLLLSGMSQGRTVCLARVDGAIGPATTGYIARCISVAQNQNAECLVLQLDTPGGLLDSTKAIVQSFLTSPVPVVVYVAPSGATAASAGCFIALAADVAAMAPTTTIGAAHPVQMGGNPGEQQGLDETMKQKLENFASSYIEMIAAKRQRNVEWARSAVRESASVPADKALELHVVDLIAADVPELLKQLEGRTVKGRVLHTADAEVRPVEMRIPERVFQTLWRPEVLFILMLIAIYGIIGELSTPGAVLPGVMGAIALILALYMSAILPVNAAGLALIVLAVVLFIIDVFAPTHGVLTAGGIVAFMVGAMMLFDRSEPLYRLSMGYIIPATLVTAGFFAFVVGKGLRAQRLPVKTGTVTMLGRTAEACSDISAGHGKIFIEGEYWNAVSTTPIRKGSLVEVKAIQGLTLEVQPKSAGGPP